jgi:hypothetical protein
LARAARNRTRELCLSEGTSVMRHAVSVLTLAGCLVLAVGNAEQPAPAPGVTKAPAAGPDLKILKYKDLCNEIRGHYGKVVVVDVWGVY